MKLGVFLFLFAGPPFEKAVDRAVGMGLGCISIEHKDAPLSIGEAFRKGVAFLLAVMPTKPPLANAWWA
jgi:hypothetical protein